MTSENSLNRIFWNQIGQNTSFSNILVPLIFSSITLYTISSDGCTQSLAPQPQPQSQSQPQPLPPCLKRMRTIVMKSILIDHFIKDVKREIVFKVSFIYYVSTCRGKGQFLLTFSRGRGSKKVDQCAYVCLFVWSIHSMYRFNASNFLLNGSRSSIQTKIHSFLKQCFFTLWKQGTSADVIWD